MTATWIRGTALAILFSMLAAGCGTTATILRADGGRVEGRISGGSADAIWLVDRAGHQSRVPRREIVDIEHPGAAAAGVGAALLVLGLLSIYYNGARCSESSNGNCFGTFAPGAIGLGLFAWGAVVHSRSVHRASEGQGGEPAPPAISVPSPAPLNASTARAPDARPASPAQVIR